MSMAKRTSYLKNRGCIHDTHKFGSKALKGLRDRGILKFKNDSKTILIL